MPFQLLASLLRSVCEETSEQTVPVRSTTGAIIFFGYIVLALLLTGAIIRVQLQAYQDIRSRTRLNSKANRGLLLRCLLAVTSFAVLSYHMLFFLIDSYTNWVLVYEADLPSNTMAAILWHLRHIWEWSTYTPLFATFASDVFVVKEADGVIFLALAWEMMIAVLITAVGWQRKIAYIWCYTFLAQILPISFIQNLFGIATLLDDLNHSLESDLEHRQLRNRDQQNQAMLNTRRWDFLEALSSIIINSFYGIVIGILPLLRRTNLLMPGVLLTRALLLLPFVVSSIGLSPLYMSAGQLKITALSTLVLVMANGFPYLKMNDGQARYLYNNLISSPTKLLWSSFGESYLALQSNHAVAALGWDIAIGIASSILCAIL